MNYAIVKIGCQQFKISEGDVIITEKIIGKAKEKVIFKEVLLVFRDKKLMIGQPLVEKAKIEAEIMEQFKDKKLRVAKFKAKSRYRRVQGHRQLKTKIKIIKISVP